MAGFVKFIAVAIFVGCSFCLVCAGNPYDMSGHFWPSQKKFVAPDSLPTINYDPVPVYFYMPSYEEKCCTFMIGYNNSFLPLGASFGTIAASILMKNLDSIVRFMFPIRFCRSGYPDVFSDSLYARKLLGKIEMDSIPAVDKTPMIDEKYFVYNPPENEFRDEKPERPKTIPAGFHNPTILIGSEDRKNVNEAMSKVEKGLCYGSIAAMILSGGNIPVLCEQHGLH